MKTTSAHARFPAPSSLHASYNKKWDTLKISTDRANAAISIDLSGGFWLQYAPEGNEVVGFEIEGYCSHFLKTRPALAAAWDKEQSQPVFEEALRVAQRACESLGNNLQVILPRALPGDGARPGSILDKLYFRREESAI